MMDIKTKIIAVFISITLLVASYTTGYMNGANDKKYEMEVATAIQTGELKLLGLESSLVIKDLELDSVRNYQLTIKEIETKKEKLYDEIKNVVDGNVDSGSDWVRFYNESVTITNELIKRSQ